MEKVWEFVASDLEVVRHKISAAKQFAEKVREDTVITGLLSIIDKDISDLLQYYPKEYFNGKTSGMNTESEISEIKRSDIIIGQFKPINICECCNGVILD